MKEKRIQFPTYFSKETHLKVRKKAFKEFTSMNSIVVDAVEKELKKKRE